MIRILYFRCKRALDPLGRPRALSLYEGEDGLVDIYDGERFVKSLAPGPAAREIERLRDELDAGEV